MPWKMGCASVTRPGWNRVTATLLARLIDEVMNFTIFTIQFFAYLLVKDRVISRVRFSITPLETSGPLGKGV